MVSRGALDFIDWRKSVVSSAMSDSEYSPVRTISKVFVLALKSMDMRVVEW
jgi:hypothetical protein